RGLHAQSGGCLHVARDLEPLRRVIGRVGALDAQQTPELQQRISRIVDPQVDGAVLPRPAAGVPSDHEHRRGLPAADVAAFGLRGVEGREHALGQRSLSGRVGVEHRAPNGVVLHEVGLAAEAIAGPVPGRGNALRAGVRRDVARGVDDRELAHVRFVVAGEQSVQRLLRRVAVLQELEAKGPEAYVHVRLRGHRANSGERPRHHRADVEVVRLHRDAKLACVFVTRDYRIGQLVAIVIRMAHYQRPDWFTKHVFNRVVAVFTRLGISVWGSRVLRVRGRKSGEWRSSPVNLLDRDGTQYLVAPRGQTQWVRNIRVSGGGELIVGSRVQPFKAIEISDA